MQVILSTQISSAVHSGNRQRKIMSFVVHVVISILAFVELKNYVSHLLSSKTCMNVIVLSFAMLAIENSIIIIIISKYMNIETQKT